MTAGADPILASVLQRRVQAISHEMATVLMRSSRSPIFNEIGDLVTVIFDRHGRTLAQTEYASIIANGAQPPLQHIIEYFGDDLHDGDVILHNDVYSGGNQNADVGVFLPDLLRGRARRVEREQGPRRRHRRHDRRRLRPARAGGVAGGVPHPAAEDPRPRRAAPRRVGPRAGEHPARDRRRGHQGDDRRVHDRQAPSRATCSSATASSGSTRTWITSSTACGAPGARRARALARRHVPRRELDGLRRPRSDPALPDRRRGDDRRLGRSRSTSPRPTTRRRASRTCRPRRRSGAIRIAFLMLLAAGGLTIPTNHGLFAPVRTVFRKGSLIDPQFPASTIFGNQMCDEVLEAIMRALAGVLPDRVTAGWNQFLCTAAQRDRPAHGRAVGVAHDLPARRPGRDARRRRLRRARLHGHAGQHALARHGDVRALDAPPRAVLRVPARLGRHGEWRGGYGTRSSWTLLRRGRGGHDDRRRRRGRGRRPGRRACSAAGPAG